MEAPPGFEPGMEVLQTSALPLGDGADQSPETKNGPWRPALTPQLRGERWSGKRDSNPRLRPWQGRTLPLSYSRSPERLKYHTHALSFNPTEHFPVDFFPEGLHFRGAKDLRRFLR